MTAKHCLLRAGGSQLSMAEGSVGIFNKRKRRSVSARLADLDPRDYQVRLDQAKAQVAQAQSALSGERPNVPKRPPSQEDVPRAVESCQRRLG